MRSFLLLALLACAPKPVSTPDVVDVPEPASAPETVCEKPAGDDIECREVWAGEQGSLKATSPDGTTLHGRLLYVAPGFTGTLSETMVTAGLSAGDEKWEWSQPWPATFVLSIQPGVTLAGAPQASVDLTHAVFPATTQQVSVSKDADDRLYRIDKVATNGSASVVGWLWVKLDGAATQELRWYKAANIQTNLFVVNAGEALRFVSSPTPTVPGTAFQLVQAPG